jgi:ribosomal protein L7/L12
VRASQVSHLIEAVFHNKKIEALKIVREMFGFGLKEAKDFVCSNMGGSQL